MTQFEIFEPQPTLAHCSGVPVITSYSIHYTKLYDHSDSVDSRRQMKKIDLGQTITILANIGVIAGIGFLALEVHQNNELMSAEARRSRTESSVITSYSIHYTKLYDVVSSYSTA